MILLLLTFLCQAIVPSHYVLERFAQRREAVESISMRWSVFKYGASGEQLFKLGDVNIAYPLKLIKEKRFVYWPLLTLIGSNDKNAIRESLNLLGIKIPTENELVKWTESEIKSAKDIPSPFYRPDESISLQRIDNKIHWQISGETKATYITSEKDLFLPSVIVAPCPSDLASLDFFDSDEMCEAKFKYVAGRNTAMGIPSTILFQQRNKPVLRIQISRVRSNPGETTIEKVKKSIMAVAKSESNIWPIVKALAH